ncbi:MAG TPA: hypothetical protein EYN66_04515 [Myxococcales bacterium]|nr:hypothetical protein [Myxococcales bacterium]
MATHKKTKIKSDQRSEAKQEVLGTFVLLPADDVPMAGTRTEIVVSPNQCLRVKVIRTEKGQLLFIEEK